LFDAAARGLRIADRRQRRHMCLQSLQALGRRVDRAANAPLRRLLGEPQGDQQVVESQHRAAGRQADDVAAGVHLPAFAEAGQHDVALFRVDEDVFQLLQAGQELHLVGDRRAARQVRGQGLFQLPQRNLPQVARLLHVGVGLRQRRFPTRAKLAQLIHLQTFDRTAGVDADTADRAGVAVIVVATDGDPHGPQRRIEAERPDDDQRRQRINKLEDATIERRTSCHENMLSRLVLNAHREGCG
jgi:hypothetical protein